MKAMAVKQRECQTEDDWTIMRGALAVLCAAALFASGAGRFGGACTHAGRSHLVEEDSEKMG